MKRIGEVEAILFKLNNGTPLFLLLKRALDRGGFWQPVTGGINPGEEIKNALVREINEETGVKDFIRIIDNVYYFEFDGGNGFMKEYVFGVEISPDQNIQISEEHTERRWCSLEEAIELLKWDSNKEGFRRLYSLLERDKA